VTPVSYFAKWEVTSPNFARNFARGCDGEVMEDDFDLTLTHDRLYRGPVALFGTPPLWPVLRQAQAEGRDWYYGDHAYYGRAGGRKPGYYRITKNAYQHDGRGNYPPDRFRLWGCDVAPWRTDGRHILICPNSAIYCQLHGFDVNAWLTDVLTTLKAHTDRPLRIRWKKSPISIKRDLVNAWAVVVFSSAAALDALMAGVPVFVLAPFAAGARMGLSDLSRIESPLYPAGREPFLWALAANQWTLGEMCSGLAWRSLQEAADRAA
jgi:hypothetical protein